MRTPLAVWIIPLAVFACAPTIRAQDADNKIVITIATVKESDLQREMMAKKESSTGLRDRLKATTLVELSGELHSDEEELILRFGKERDIVSEWGFAPEHNGVVARKTITELIGTEIKVVNMSLDVDPTRATRLSIHLTHDLQAPQMQSMTYATAATGAEREQKSVTAPRFKRLRWQGEVLASKDERLIASFLLEEDADRRIAVFIRGTLQGSRDNPPPPATVRQTIYRVPEMGMIEWALDGPQSDTALEKRLQETVAAGQASLISDLATVTALATPTQTQASDECWIPWQIDQDLNRLYQLPISFQTVRTGIRLECGSSQSEFLNSHFAPRPPLAVQWPTSWLRVYDRAQGKATGQAIHGRVDWYDRFEQETSGQVAFHDESPHLISMMSPADQTWGTERKGRWLDVTVAQRLQGGDQQQAPSPTSPAAPPAPPPPAEPFAPGQQPSFALAAPPPLLLLGIALDSDQAQALLTARQPGKDEDLLRKVVARVNAGQAHVVTCVVSANQTEGRYKQDSVRTHVYPTEMPSIPSSWGQTGVGARLEQEGEILALHQDLAPPARTEWKLAQDMPEAIMWQPRFRRLSIKSESSAFTKPGTRLCAVTSIPAVMSGGGIPEHETVLLFAHRSIKGPAPKNTSDDFEVETLIFEIPSKHAAEWQVVKSDDLTAFTQQRLKQGTAKLQSHTMLRTRASIRSSLDVTEEYNTATEFDPPSREAPNRMRPTALMTLPVGLQLEVEVSAASGEMPQLHVSLKHSTARPVEPGLAETLQISTSGKNAYPGAKHEFDEWTETIRPIPGKFHSLLLPPAGSDAATTRIVFIQLRPAQ